MRKREGKFDAVLCYPSYRWPSFWRSYFAARKSGSAFILGTDASSLISRSGSKWKLIVKELFWPQLFSLADQVIVPSSEGRDLLLSAAITNSFQTGSPDHERRIVLDNGVVIGCYPCTYDGVRGRTVIAVVCDELAFWSNEEQSANPADEVIAALRPAMATARNPKLIKISTPFGKMGLLWEEFQRRGELDFPVFQLTTHEMNPAVPAKVLERESKRDEEKYCREYLAQFTDSINGWITSEILEPCIIRGRHQLPFLPKVRYVAALDPASQHNDFALAILHMLPSGKIVVDYVARWAGTKSAPLAFEMVLGQVRDILSLYRINSVIGDQFYFDATSQHLLKLGITYEERVFGANTRAEKFGNLKHLVPIGHHVLTWAAA